MSSGTELAIAASSTPGSDRRRRSNRRKVAGERRVDVASRQIVGGEQHAFAPEARIRVARLAEAADEERRRHEDDQREADLDAHERAPHPAAAGRARSRSERDLRIHARQLRRRRHAEDDAADDPEQHGEGEADRVHACLELDRNRADHRDRTQRIGGPDGNHRAKRRAEQRQHQVFREQLADKAPRAGAKGQAHAHLPVARAGSREHEIRGVAADRQQQEQHHRLQDCERAHQEALRAPRRLPERKHLGLHCPIRVGVVVGQLDGHTAPERVAEKREPFRHVHLSTRGGRSFVSKRSNVRPITVP